MVTTNNDSLDRWIEYVFDHAVTDPAWHWASDAAEWNEPPRQLAEHMTDAFEQSGRLLARFSDEQLNQGFWCPQIGKVVDEFLSATPNLRPELVSYAHRAKVGNVL